MDKMTEVIVVGSGHGWGLWVLIPLGVMVVSLLAGLAAARLCNNRPHCFASNPSPIDMGYLKCHECDESGECLR